MKHLYFHAPALAAALLAAPAVSCLNVNAAEPHPGHVEFGTFQPASEDTEFVEVNIRKNLLSMAARLAENRETEVAEVLRGLHQVRVNVLGLTDDTREAILGRVQSIRAQLDENAWDRIVTVQQESEDVTVHLKMQTDQAVDGIVVTVVEGDRRVVLVNVVGDIRPEKLALIGERFNIGPLRKIGESLNRGG